MFPRDSGTTHTHGAATWPTRDNGLIRPTLSTRRKQGHSGSKQVRVVCKHCNETWLSLLENSAKPVLLPLITGSAGAREKEKQSILSSWAAKIAMTAEHINKGKNVMLQSELTWMRMNCMPPKGWNIWVAPYSGTEWRDLGIYQHSGKLTIPPGIGFTSGAHSLQLTYMGLGRVLFLAVSSSWDRLWDILDRLDVPGATRIWPIRQENIAWPSPDVFTDSEVAALRSLLPKVFESRV